MFLTGSERCSLPVKFACFIFIPIYRLKRKERNLARLSHMLAEHCTYHAGTAIVTVFSNIAYLITILLFYADNVQFPQQTDAKSSLFL